MKPFDKTASFAQIMLAVALLVTVASSAQIGTSHSKISIMQIDSMKISRKTWITTETQTGPQKILKVLKGNAIISERYIQEAQMIASELGKPINIEKNTISRELEKTMLTEFNSIDQSEISISNDEGYNDKERQSLEKIIAQISVVFWIKENNELSKIQVSPKITWKITSDYEDSNGEWQQNMENGWTSFIPGGAIISKPIEVFKKTTRIGERSCITKTNVTTTSTMEADIIKLSQSETATITENCRIGNRQITSKSKIKETSQITLPLECSITSPLIRCGRIKYIFENEEINQARIRRISVLDLTEEKEETKNLLGKEHIIVIIIISLIIIIIAIIAVKKYATSTPKKPGSQSPESISVEEIEMDEMGRFRCLRPRNNSSDDREHYSIYNSYNSLDGSWRLDRANGENRSLNDTDIRRALIDSRFHHDKESARNCCYNSSNFTQENDSEMQNSGEENQQITGTTSNPPSNIKQKRKKKST